MDVENRSAPAAGSPPWLVRWSDVGARVLVLVVLVWLLAVLVAKVTLVAVTVLVGLLLAGVLEPVVDRVERVVRRWVAALVVVLALLVMLVGAVWLLGERIAEQVPDLRDQMQQALDDLSGAMGVQLGLSDALGGGSGGGSGGRSDGAGAEGGRADGSGSGPGGLPSSAISLARTALESLIAGFVALALAFLFLKDGARMWRWLLDRLTDDRRHRVEVSGEAAWTTAGTYVRMLTVVAAFDAVGVGLGLWVLGVPLVLTLAALQFLLSYIPTIGAWVAGGAAALVAFVSNGLVTALLTVGLVILVQQLGNSVLEPWLMGSALGLHPAVVLVAVTAGGVLWGIPGALLFVPLAAALAAAARAWTGERMAHPPA